MRPLDAEIKNFEKFLYHLKDSFSVIRGIHVGTCINPDAVPSSQINFLSLFPGVTSFSFGHAHISNPEWNSDPQTINHICFLNPVFVTFKTVAHEVAHLISNAPHCDPKFDKVLERLGGAKYIYEWDDEEFLKWHALKFSI